MDDNQSDNLKRALPNTPRVSDKIMEYYQKFGHNRDLEKFMRLYSPASSHGSHKTQSDDCGGSHNTCCRSTKSRETLSSNSSCEALPVMLSRPLGEINSKSLPNIDVQGQSIGAAGLFAADDVIVDIKIDTEVEMEKVLSASAENLETPKKAFINTQTQTPDSVAKSHRRLEWDSLGDIGYKKAMSTSNISVIERSLLKEFFKESVVSESGINSTAIKEIQQLPEDCKSVKKIKANEIEHSTPPLACSTLVETTQKKGAKPKIISQSTSSTSLHKKFEKYAQTSLLKPPTVHSQEVQCSMSSSNSVIEGTATPSSFEYYSSRSSKSRSSISSDFVQSKNLHQEKRPSFEHPFISTISDLLMKRKVLGEKNQQKHKQLNNIRELQTKFQAALDENKENQTHYTIASSSTTSFSLSRQAPELDLGIQLICSLIDAKSVNDRQKKQLIRDIVKRITRLESGEESAVNSSNGTTANSTERSSINSKHKQENKSNLKFATEPGVSPLFTQPQDHNKEISRNQSRSANSMDENVTPDINSKGESTANSNHCHVYDSVRSNISNKHDQENVSNSKISTTVGVCYYGNAKNSSTTTSNTHANITRSDNLVSRQPKDKIKLKPASSKNKISSTCEYALKENNTNMPTINKEVQCELINKMRSKERNKEIISNNNRDVMEAKETESSSSSMHNKNSRSTQTSKTISSVSTTSTSTTPDLTTQKLIASNNNDLNNSNTDAEQPTMREWLNPLTHSEIEYEEKKRKEKKKKAGAAEKEKILKKSKSNSGRVEQLNWIENEIKRLECLKHLLLKDESTEKSSITVSSIDCTTHNNRNVTKETTQSEKLYDTVYSDKSSVLSESAERLAKEIEIILEESHEDFVHLPDNLKRTKNHKKETQIIYEKDNPSKNIKPKFRTIRESLTINEEQLLNVDKKIHNQRRQRDKIDTPSTDKSQESESLKDLVHQRKREFMEAYKTKKQNHYEALKQQQKEDFKYLNIQHKKNEKIVTADSDQYSVPHSLPSKYLMSNESYAYTQHPLPLTPTEREAILKNVDPKHKNIVYSTSDPKQQKENMVKDNINTSCSNTNTTTTSSSSMFCISSDVSVPMGSQNSTSTPTTTHQYDDVAAAVVAGVAVQTSDSIFRSKPIYGPRRFSSTVKPHNTTSLTTTACIQVKPKGIAYVIEFDDDKETTSKSSNNTDTNSNDLVKKSSYTNLPNNIKALLTTEPQLTLQEHLEKSKPEFLQHSKERKAILNQLQSMRQERDRKLREIIDNTSFNSLDKRLQYLPPPPIQKLRILNTKEMKALTNKRFSNLPEVLAKQEREIEEKKRRSNRILRDIFNRRLQNRVRIGKLSLNHSKTVI